MSRATRARRTRRRARKAREANEPTPPQPEKPIDWERVAARFRCLQGRAIRLGFALIGPPVPARTPAELEENTAFELARLLNHEPEN